MTGGCNPVYLFLVHAWGVREQQVWFCTQNILSKQGRAPEELPPWAPGQAGGLKKKNLPETEIRDHPGTVWDLSLVTQQKQSELSPAATFAQVFITLVPKSRRFASKLCSQPQAGYRGWFRAVNSAERWYLILGVVVGSTGEGGSTTAAGLGLAGESSSSTLLCVNKSPCLINLAPALPAYTVQIFYLRWK